MVDQAIISDCSLEMITLVRWNISSNTSMYPLTTMTNILTLRINHHSFNPSEKEEADSLPWIQEKLENIFL